MGNSSSFGLIGGATRSSRDIRLRDPEKEVERPPASRAPTHNEYGELPASQKPYTFGLRSSNVIHLLPGEHWEIWRRLEVGWEKVACWSITASQVPDVGNILNETSHESGVFPASPRRRKITPQSAGALPVSKVESSCRQLIASDL